MQLTGRWRPTCVPQLLPGRHTRFVLPGHRRPVTTSPRTPHVTAPERTIP